MEAQLQAEHLWFHYTDEEGNRLSDDVLKDVSLTIEKGSFTAILGHNGSGKSTLAKLMNAILLPTKGTMYAAGIDTRDDSHLFDIRRQIGMVFQNPDNQIVATIVEEDVAFGPENLGVEPKEIRRRVEEALHLVDLYEYRLHAPSQLSGGQKQRVAIAGIIAMQPDCIILDEPTAMLDPKGRAEVMQAIHMLNRNGMTVVLITHYMEEAVQAGRVLVMDNGTLLMDGTPEEVFSHREALQAVGLDVPQSVALLDGLRSAGIPLTETGITADRCAAQILAYYEKK